LAEGTTSRPAPVTMPTPQEIAEDGLIIRSLVGSTIHGLQL
jgi:hypothetical protein